MKKLLVLCQNYPSKENPFSQPFVHYRIKEYLEHFDVTVLSFATKENYHYEGVKVFNENSVTSLVNYQQFDLVISHAPNVRNHQRFLLLNLFKFNQIVFVFHGYEVIDIHKRVYNQPTHFEFPLKFSLLKKIYHKMKLPLTCLFLKAVRHLVSTKFVFVSETLLSEAEQDLGCNIFQKDKNTFIINNPINHAFFDSPYIPTKAYDYVCIRPFDDPKYGIDIFIKLAEKHPDYSFHLYGTGTLNLSALPKNLSVIKKFLTTDELVSILPQYKAAILPTRWDSQGVLACEIAATGMPLYTSDLQVCLEMLGKYRNVKFIKNEIFHNIDLQDHFPEDFERSEKLFSHLNTTHKEIHLVKSLFELEDQA